MFVGGGGNDMGLYDTIYLYDTTFIHFMISNVNFSRKPCTMSLPPSATGLFLFLYPRVRPLNMRASHHSFHIHFLFSLKTWPCTQNSPQDDLLLFKRYALTQISWSLYRFPALKLQPFSSHLDWLFSRWTFPLRFLLFSLIFCAKKPEPIECQM